MRSIKLPKILQPFHCADLKRFGKDNDGGYLVNIEDVKKSNTLLSFGIGGDISFEKDFDPCDLFAFDKSVTNPDLTFFSGSRKFIPKNVGSIGDEKNITLETVLNKVVGKAFLKCDVDGFEYQLFDQIINNDHRFSGIVLEVHDIADYSNFDRLTDFISKIGLKLIHVHINNYSYYDYNGKITPNVVELTFTSSYNYILKRDLTLPHILDMPCNPDGIDFSVTF